MEDVKFKNEVKNPDSKRALRCRKVSGQAKNKKIRNVGMKQKKQTHKARVCPDFARLLILLVKTEKLKDTVTVFCLFDENPLKVNGKTENTPVS